MNPQFIQQIHELLGQQEGNELIEALGTAPSVSVRLNPRKSCELSLPLTDRVPWCQQGYYLTERPNFALDPLWSAGAYYVQDASSMFYTHILRQITDPDTPIRYLDACAAPGGKTTCALSVLSPDSLVVANEYVQQRANILHENLRKWGASDAIVTCSDTAPFARLKSHFDIVAIDAPCSGEGMMRKEEVAVSQWSPGLVRQCAALQWEIVSNLWPLIQPGGYLIYSTCTFNRTENEEMVERICNEFGGETVEIPVQPEWGVKPGINTDKFCYRFMPHRVRGEGLFVSVIRKPGTGTASIPACPKERKPLSTPAGRYMLRPAEAEMIKQLQQAKVRILSPGAIYGIPKGKDFIPSTETALSWYNINVDPKVELDTQQALSYLRREAIVLPPDTPRGYVTVSYCGLPLGLVKNLGNRANNLWPQHWRLRVHPTKIPKLTASAEAALEETPDLRASASCPGSSMDTT